MERKPRAFTLNFGEKRNLSGFTLILRKAKTLKSEKAFTLIELLMVIAIIGILAALIVVSLTSARGKAQDTQRKNNARNIDSALAQYQIEHLTKYPVLDVAGGTDWSSAATAATKTALSAYLKATSAYVSTLPAKFITDGDGSSYGQAWQMANDQENAVVVGNGVYATSASGVGGVTTAGKASGDALNFASSTSAQSITNVAAYNSAAFSVSFWVRPGRLAFQQLVGKYAGANGWQVAMNGAGGNITFQLFVGGASQGIVTSVTPLTVGTWYHIVATYTGNTAANGIKLYINSTGAPDIQGTATIAGANTTVVNGNISVAGPQHYEGDVDDLRLYNVALSGAATAVIRDNAGNKFGQYANNGEASIVAGWRFDDGTAITATDLKAETVPSAAGTGNNITLSGTLPTWIPGIVPLGLAWTGGNITDRAFVTYGPQ